MEKGNEGLEYESGKLSGLNTPVKQMRRSNNNLSDWWASNSDNSQGQVSQKSTLLDKLNRQNEQLRQKLQMKTQNEQENKIDRIKSLCD